MAEETKKSNFTTNTGSLKFGSGEPVLISEQECWVVPNLGIYDEFGKFLGETEDEAAATLARRQAAAKPEK